MNVCKSKVMRCSKHVNAGRMNARLGDKLLGDVLFQILVTRNEGIEKDMV